MWVSHGLWCYPFYHLINHRVRSKSLKYLWSESMRKRNFGVSLCGNFSYDFLLNIQNYSPSPRPKPLSPRSLLKKGIPSYLSCPVPKNCNVFAGHRGEHRGYPKNKCVWVWGSWSKKKQDVEHVSLGWCLWPVWCQVISPPREGPFPLDSLREIWKRN